jgi:hypothetical protein
MRIGTKMSTISFLGISLRSTTEECGSATLAAERKNGVSYKSKNVNTDEDLRQAIGRWKNSVLPALEVKDTQAWIDSFGKEPDLGNGVLEDYCRDVDYEGSRMSMLRKIRGDLQ